jgi:hypothetical protein
MRLNRSLFVKAWLFFLAVAVLGAAAASAADRSNILFIYSDDYSDRTVGSYPQSYRGSSADN